MFTATVTPFDERGVFQPEWQAQHLAWLQARGIEGVVVAGTNGEGPSLSADERRAVIDTAVANRGTLHLIVGTGTPSLEDTISLSRYALEAGADAAMIVPPYYFRNVPEDGLLRYYRAVCDALPPTARIVLYHIPSVSGVPITHSLIAGLLESHPDQCYGIKDTSGDAAQTGALIAAFPQLHVLGGSDHLTAANLRAGVEGQISGLANAFPELFAGLIAAFRAGGNIDVWQARIDAVRAITGRYPQLAAIKALAAWRAELPSIAVKPPLGQLTPAQRATLQDDIAALDGV
jgi:4-hydroxy-tetrahydrodipicolinate synthase